MVLTKTPFSILMIGDGIDIDNHQFYQGHEGMGISVTIDKYCYVSVRHLPRFFDYRDQIIYSRIENVKNVDDIEHPMVKQAMKMLDMHELRVAYDADLPAKSGIGTSGAFAVGMLNAFYALKGKYIDKKGLADSAIYLEKELCQELSGIQSQISSAFGGINLIHFSKKGYEVSPIVLTKKRKEDFEKRLMLIYTGVSCKYSYNKILFENLIKNRMDIMVEISQLAKYAEKVLTSEMDLREFGKIMSEAWKLKKQIAPDLFAANTEEIYSAAIRAGAIGGEFLGMGERGFLLLYVEPEYRKKVIESLGGLMNVPFRFVNYGSEILHYNAEEYSFR